MTNEERISKLEEEVRLLSNKCHTLTEGAYGIEARSRRQKEIDTNFKTLKKSMRLNSNTNLIAGVNCK